MEDNVLAANCARRLQGTRCIDLLIYTCLQKAIISSYLELREIDILS